MEGKIIFPSCYLQILTTSSAFCSHAIFYFIFLVTTKTLTLDYIMIFSEKNERDTLQSVEKVNKRKSEEGRTDHVTAILTNLYGTFPFAQPTAQKKSL